jgi:hypothetical protein
MININKNSVKYLQGICFSQLILAEKPEVNNLSHVTPDVVTNQSSSIRKQTYVKKFSPAIYIYAKHKWSTAERNALLSPSH